jgi:hypothetical protein
MVGIGFGTIGAQQRYGMKGMVKEFEDTNAHMSCRALGWAELAHMSCRDLGLAELGQKTEAGLGQKTEAELGQKIEAELGQKIGAGQSMAGPKYRGRAGAKNRGWTGQRLEAGLDRGQRLGWTEAEQRLDTGRAGPKNRG